MGAKSVAAVQVKTGSPAAGVVSSDCVELDKRNQEQRAVLSETGDKSINRPRHNGKGSTVSSCSSSRGKRTAHSNQKAFEKCPSGLVSGKASNLSEGDRKRVRNGTKATTCGHVHPDPAAQKSGHAEARLLDSMSGTTMPSKMTFNIDWHKGAGGTSKMPCKTCHEYMCTVSKECDVDISLCDRSNVAHPLPCPANRKNRQALKKKLDGRRRNPRP